MSHWTSNGKKGWVTSGRGSRESALAAHMQHVRVRKPPNARLLGLEGQRAAYQMMECSGLLRTGTATGTLHTA